MSRLAAALRGFPPGSTITPAMQRDQHQLQRMVNLKGLTHQQHAAERRLSRSCSAHDVLAGGQCGNCLWKSIR